MNDLNLYRQLSTLDMSAGLPPVERWNPTVKGEVDIRIAADGTWYHEGNAIRRLELVRLFASVLWLEGDSYFLVTPVEKMKIRVDDAPLLVNDVDFVEQNGIPVARMRTLTGDVFNLDNDHLLRVETSAEGEPRPYVRVRRNLDALLHRNVFYRLIAHAEERTTPAGTQWIVVSDQREHVLGMAY